MDEERKEIEEVEELNDETEVSEVADEEETADDSGMPGVVKAAIITAVTAVLGGIAYCVVKGCKRFKDNRKILKEYYEAHPNGYEEEEEGEDVYEG